MQYKCVESQHVCSGEYKLPNTRGESKIMVMKFLLIQSCKIEESKQTDNLKQIETKMFKLLKYVVGNKNVCSFYTALQ